MSQFSQKTSKKKMRIASSQRGVCACARETFSEQKTEQLLENAKRMFKSTWFEAKLIMSPLHRTYKDKLWCYLGEDDHESCGDSVVSGKFPGRRWSHKACGVSVRSSGSGARLCGETSTAVVSID